MKDTFSVVFLMELKKFFNNKKVLISSFLLPILIVSFVIYGVTTLEKDETEGSIFIYCDKNIEQAILNIDSEEKVEVFYSDANLPFESLVSSKRNYIGILVDEVQHKITVGYDSSLLSTTDLVYMANEIANKLNIALNSSDSLGNYTSGEPLIYKNDISNASDRVISSLKPILMMVSIIAVMMVCTSLITLSTDTVAGERERGTFDIFRLSGRNLSLILLGKTAFIVAIGFAVMVIECFVCVFCIKVLNPELFNMIISCCDNLSMVIVAIIISSIELSLLCSACFVLLSSLFDKIKQASSYCSIGMIIISIAVSPTAFSDNKLLSYIPITNFTETILLSISNTSNIFALVISMLISISVSLLMLFLASTHIERDSVK